MCLTVFIYVCPLAFQIPVDEYSVETLTGGQGLSAITVQLIVQPVTVNPSHFSGELCDILRSSTVSFPVSHFPLVFLCSAVDRTVHFGDDCVALLGAHAESTAISSLSGSLVGFSATVWHIVSVVALVVIAVETLEGSVTIELAVGKVTVIDISIVEGFGAKAVGDICHGVLPSNDDLAVILVPIGVVDGESRRYLRSFIFLPFLQLTLLKFRSFILFVS